MPTTDPLSVPLWRDPIPATLWRAIKAFAALGQPGQVTLHFGRLHQAEKATFSYTLARGEDAGLSGSGLRTESSALSAQSSLSPQHAALRPLPEEERRHAAGPLAAVLAALEEARLQHGEGRRTHGEGGMTQCE
jgi:hypothetical protein